MTLSIKSNEANNDLSSHAKTASSLTTCYSEIVWSHHDEISDDNTGRGGN